MENVMNLLMGFGTVFSFENLGVCLLGSVLGLASAPWRAVLCCCL